MSKNKIKIYPGHFRPSNNGVKPLLRATNVDFANVYFVECSILNEKVQLVCKSDLVSK